MENTVRDIIQNMTSSDFHQVQFDKALRAKEEEVDDDKIDYIEIES